MLVTGLKREKELHAALSAHFPEFKAELEENSDLMLVQLELVTDEQEPPLAPLSLVARARARARARPRPRPSPLAPPARAPAAQSEIYTHPC